MERLNKYKGYVDGFAKIADDNKNKLPPDKTVLLKKMCEHINSDIEYIQGFCKAKAALTGMRNILNQLNQALIQLNMHMQHDPDSRQLLNSSAVENNKNLEQIAGFMANIKMEVTPKITMQERMFAQKEKIPEQSITPKPATPEVARPKAQ